MKPTQLIFNLFDSLGGLKRLNKPGSSIYAFSFPISAWHNYKLGIDSLISEQVKGHFIYFLIDDTKAVRSVYVGESKNFSDRIYQHDKDVNKTWTKTVVISSNDQSLSGDVAQYLEYALIQKIKKYNRAESTNFKSGNSPILDDYAKPNLLEIENLIETFIRALDYAFISPVAASSSDNDSKFMCKFEDLISYGNLIEGNGFIVYKGSKIRKDQTEGISDSSKRLRDQYYEKGLFIESDNYFELKEDIEFTSPSAASGFVLARSSNGWDDWRDEEGKKLDQMR